MVFWQSQLGKQSLHTGTALLGTERKEQLAVKDGKHRGVE